MGFFAPTPKVSKNDFRKVRNSLLQKGLSHRDINDLEAVMLQAMDQGGADKREVRDVVRYLKDKPGAHNISDSQIKLIEDALEDKL